MIMLRSRPQTVRFVLHLLAFIPANLYSFIVQNVVGFNYLTWIFFCVNTAIFICHCCREYVGFIIWVQVSKICFSFLFFDPIFCTLHVNIFILQILTETFTFDKFFCNTLVFSWKIRFNSSVQFSQQCNLLFSTINNYFRPSKAFVLSTQVLRPLNFQWTQHWYRSL